MNDPFFLDWAGLAVSLFNTISFFWLGLTVLLNGNRRSLGTWLTGGGLVLGAGFFVCHTAILGRGLAASSVGMDRWWQISWVPAIIAPLAWYSAALWYVGFRVAHPHSHRYWLLTVIVMALLAAGLLALVNPLPSYRHVSEGTLVPGPKLFGVPLGILVYLVYASLCFLLPLELLRGVHAAHSPVIAAARRRARPWVIASSFLLLAAGVVVVWTALWALHLPLPVSLSDPAIATPVKRFDLAAACFIAMAVTLIGRAIVSYAVFTGRMLPRRGFFRQWRSTVILAAGLGVVVSWTFTINLRPIYILILTTIIVTLFHALFSWRSFAEREQFMSQLRPFVASQQLYDQMLKPGALDAAVPRTIFETLCGRVLGADAAALVPTGALTALAGPSLVYGRLSSPIPPSSDLAAWFPAEARFHPAAEAGVAWAVALRDENGLSGVLLLGDKADGNPYTEEELEIAQAGGERILDSIAGAEMARLSMELLRQRLAQMRVLEGQGRRLLHDQVLPQLHTSILYLSGLRDDPAVGQAVEALTAAHREISALIREVQPTAPQQLGQQGLAAALRQAVEKDFRQDLAEVAWDISPEAEQAACKLPLFVSEVVFFAAQELLRNAARHGRGEEKERPLRLAIRLEQAGGLRLSVQDDGVGFSPGRSSSSGGSGGGLRFHSTMLAAVGARLEVAALPGGGTRGTITLVEGAWGGGGQGDKVTR